jgi:hypothetical protein
MSGNPYMNLPNKAFWKLSVSDRNMFDIVELWDPKFEITKNHKVVTYGSCFAQHIGNALQNKGFNWLRTELAPRGLSKSNCKKFNFNIFSARTGNIYTTSLLKQWVDWALDVKPMPDEIWERDGRFIDPFRPLVEPNGFASEVELRESQKQTKLSFKNSIIKADFFVFTLGLTESWINDIKGYEYPMCPGTIGGEFDDIKHKFENQQFQKIITNLIAAIELMLSVNPQLKFILTVSPVPLTATNSGKHVAVATMASKSILRAVADQISTNRPYVDYYPSYEIINSPIFRGTFFEPNQRSVNPVGVNFVMDSFFKCQLNKYLSQSCEQNAISLTANVKNDVCEEELLDAFSQ